MQHINATRPLNRNPTTTVSVTVIIPAYNYAHYLPRALESIYRQTCLPARVVVVDDGSTDDTPTVLEACRARAPVTLELVTIRQLNQGPSTARNTGLLHVESDYVMFLDADDALLPDAVENLTEAITNFAHPAMVIGGRYSVHENGIRVARPAFELSGNRDKDFAAYVDGRFRISNGTAAISRRVFERFRFPEEMRNNEDMVVDALILANYTCRSIATPVAEIHAHPGRLRNAISASLDNALEVTERIFDSGKMPEELMHHRCIFLTGRYLSRFRSFYRAGNYPMAWTNYRNALRTQASKALKPDYLVKAASCALKIAFNVKR